MESFYIGLAGALVGGLFLSLTVTAIFYLEKKQATKDANKIVEDLKAMYYNKINDQSSVGLKTKTKLN